MILRIAMAAFVSLPSLVASAQYKSSAEVKKLEQDLGTIYVIHRRNALTLQEYYQVGYGEEIAYPLRKENPIFRLYTIGLADQ